jgi:hypothetical protein
MWAISVYDLGLTEQQFRKLTLKLFNELLKRKNHNDKIKDFQLAQIAHFINNAYFEEKKTINDLMIYKEEEEIQTVEQAQNILVNLNALFGGEDLRQQHSE